MPKTVTERLVQFFLSYVVMICVLLASHKILDYERSRLELFQKQEHDKKMLQEEARTDQLTGLYNRLAMNICFSEINSDTNASSSYILVIADLDSFKHVNDTFGHVRGDAILYRVGAIIAKNCKGGLAFRYGGDEYLIIGECDNEDEVKDLVAHMEEGIKKQVRRMSLPFELSASCGYIMTDPTSSLTLAEYIKQADDVMYEHKKQSYEAEGYKR